MATYAITAPNGKTLEVTGDRMPTEAELHQIFAAAGVETQTQPESATSRFLGGAWKNLNPVTMVEGAVNAVRHPIDTGGAILLQNLEELKKAAANAQQGRYAEAVGHGAAGLLPVIGPAAAAAGERIGSGDVAGGLGESTGLLAPFGVGPAVRGAGTAARGAVTAARSIPAGADALDAVANIADRGATNRIVDVAAPKVGPNKLRLNQKMADLAPDLAREPNLSALSRQGLAAKVDAKLADATAELDATSDARLASQQIRTAPLLASIDQRIAELTAQPVEASQSTPKITGDWQLSPNGFKRPVEARPIGQNVEPAPNAAQIATLKTIRNEVAQLGDVAPYESVRRIRQAWDQVAKVKYLPSSAGDALKSQGEATAAMKGTGALRDALAAADPATAAANAQYSLFKSAHDILAATEETERARPRVLRGIVARTGGAMIGAETGGMPGAVGGVLLGSLVERAAELAPTPKIVVARQLATIADWLRNGETERATDALRTLTRRLPAARMANQVGQATAGVPQEPRAVGQ